MKRRDLLYGAFCVVFALLWLFLLLWPIPRFSRAASERYLCDWEDGVTEESYFTAYRDFSSVAEDGTPLLLRDGRTGQVRTGDAYKSLFRTLFRGSLAELLEEGTPNSNPDFSSLSRLEKAALYRKFRVRLWYADEWFGWSGTEFGRVSSAKADEVVLLSGRLSSSRLAATGATTLELRSEAEFTAKTLAGTSVSRVLAAAPFRATENAVYLDTAGGTRLVAGLPAVNSLTVSDVAFADEGALLPCSTLVSLEVPFAGSSASGVGTGFRGELAHLFSTGTEYRVPQTLRRVKVRGGVLVSHAFYRCGMLEEIDACGIDPEAIARDAFSDCTALRYLHTPRADVILYGNYRSHVADCGCTVYELSSEVLL